MLIVSIVNVSHLSCPGFPSVDNYIQKPPQSEPINSNYSRAPQPLIEPRLLIQFPRPSPRNFAVLINLARPRLHPRKPFCARLDDTALVNRPELLQLQKIDHHYSLRSKRQICIDASPVSRRTSSPPDSGSLFKYFIILEIGFN